MKESGKLVSVEEMRQIQLEMLDEIDKFCREHKIRYSLAFGTLLGAIRHKGYIPWDDDVDIIMPLPDMLRFKKEFTSEKLEYCDLDTVVNYEFHFSRIAYKPTYTQKGPSLQSYGVCIDLYPVVGMPDTKEQVQKFLTEIQPLYKKRLWMIRWNSRLVKHLPITSIPCFKKVVKRFRNTILYTWPYEKAHNYLHAGSVRPINVLDYDVFETMTDVEFEGHTYQSVGDYDRYLRHCFNDYMQLPPEEDRHPYHGFVCYWK